MIPLPIEGWVEKWSSYRMSIVRAVVTGIRDNGPLGFVQVKHLITSNAIGGDVRKASPTFDEMDGVQRIINLLVLDIDVITEREDGLYVDSDVRTCYSALLNQSFDIPSAEDAAQAKDWSLRFTHLRRWILTQPFSFNGAWANGIVVHDDTEVAAAADYIRDYGYHSDRPIVRDQNGLLIDGHLRHAALVKLGMEVGPYTHTLSFANDPQRLAYIVAAHCSFKNGVPQWPTRLKDRIVHYIDTAMSRSGVKMQWPEDIPVAISRLDISEDSLMIPAFTPAESTALSSDVMEPVAPQGKHHKVFTEQMPQKGKQSSIVMIVLLERGQRMTLEEMGVDSRSTSVVYRHENVGWIVAHHEDDPTTYSLTPKGVEMARRVWKRDRPDRHPPR